MKSRDGGWWWNVFGQFSERLEIHGVTFRTSRQRPYHILNSLKSVRLSKELVGTCRIAFRDVATADGAAVNDNGNIGQRPLAADPEKEIDSRKETQIEINKDQYGKGGKRRKVSFRGTNVVSGDQTKGAAHRPDCFSDQVLIVQVVVNVQQGLWRPDYIRPFVC